LGEQGLDTLFPFLVDQDWEKHRDVSSASFGKEESMRNGSHASFTPEREGQAPCVGTYLVFPLNLVREATDTSEAFSVASIGLNASTHASRVSIYIPPTLDNSLIKRSLIGLKFLKWDEGLIYLTPCYYISISLFFERIGIECR
jgi:hypothetical protein